MPSTLTGPARLAVLRKVRWVLGCFILALILSGLSAFPLRIELDRFAALRGIGSRAAAEADNGFDRWILVVRDGLRESYASHPWLAYGTDWLAFAHLVIALFFIGAFRDPVRNVWILKAGLIACVLVIPLALICGAIREIPLGWRLMDCSFGVIGALPLLYALRLTRVLEMNRSRPDHSEPTASLHNVSR
jgi:hypothetical protein